MLGFVVLLLVFLIEIEYILNPNKILKDKEKDQYNLILGWKLNNEKPITQKALLNNKTINKKTLEMNIDPITETIYIPYNGDTNVANAVKEIKKRIITLKWRLKNQYFLFGLKKGIKQYIITNKEIELIKGQELIKTEKDLKTIENTFHKMTTKLISLIGEQRKEKNKKTILIGIPYEDRIKERYNPLIKIIHELEKGYTTEKIDRTKLKNDFGKEENGEIYKAYNQRNQEEEIIAIPRDLSRDENQERTVTEIESEIERENNEKERKIDMKGKKINHIREGTEKKKEIADPCDECDEDCDGCEFNENDN